MNEQISNKSKLRLEYEQIYPDFDTESDSDIPAYIPWIELKLQQLEAKLAQLKEDCAPFQAQIDQRKTYKLGDEFAQLEGESKMLRLMMAADISAFVDLTEKVHEHPENYEHICLCELCRSYGD